MYLMATYQTIQHFSKYSSHLKGPCLEIGSLIDPSYKQYLPKNIHQLHSIDDYTGVDIFEGEGVDVCANLCREEDMKKLPFTSYNTIHCHYVMEHVTDIFSMAKNIAALLNEDGVLLFSVPFAWRIHRIPVDMWRFTPQSIDYLFPDVEFINDRCAISLRHGNKFFALDKFPELDFGSGLKKYPAYIKLWVKVLRRLGLHNDLFNQRALLPEMNLMMYGVKRKSPVYTYFDAQYL